MESNLRDESMLEWWKKTSGLHTVEVPSPLPTVCVVATRNLSPRTG